MNLSPELLIDAKASLGEGAIWNQRLQRLHWVDIEQHEVHTFDPESGQDVVLNLGQQVGTIVSRKSGGAMVSLRDGLAALDLDSGNVTMVADPEPDVPQFRFNDGKCDPAGRFWAGTSPIASDLRPLGGLYCLFPDLSFKQMLDKVTVSNGIVWTQDNKSMYYIDTITYRVDAFDYDLETGAIRNRRTLIDIPKNLAYPDGSTLDEEGMLWVAQFGSGTVNRWNPRTGKMIAQIKVPAPNVTSCAFGGPNLDRLYITSARVAMDEAGLQRFPHSGGVFVVEPGVKGLPADEFAG